MVIASVINPMYPIRKHNASVFVSGLYASNYNRFGNNALMQNRIKELRKNSGLSMEALAERAGTTRATIMKLEKGDMRLTTDWMRRIADGLHCDPTDLISNSHQKIPVLGSVGAGGEIIPIDDLPLINPMQLSEQQRDELNCEWVDAPPGVSSTHVACVVVRGNSMYPVYKDREYLFYRRTPRACSDSIGLDCVVCLEDGRMMVKTVRKGSNYGTYTLDSYNQPPILDVRLQWCAPVEWTHKKV